MCLMGRGPWTSKRLDSFSGVTDAAAARARGEFVLSGPPAEPAGARGFEEGLLGPLEAWLVTVFRDEDREPAGLARIEVGEDTDEDEKRREFEEGLV